MIAASFGALCNFKKLDSFAPNVYLIRIEFRYYLVTVNL